MKHLFVLLLLLIVCSTNGQVFNLAKLKTLDELRIDTNSIITITDLSAADQTNIIIINETGSLAFRGKRSGKNLIFNISDTIAKNPSAVLMLRSETIPLRLLIVPSKSQSVGATISGKRNASMTFTGIAFWDAMNAYNIAITDPCNEAAKSELLKLAKVYSNNDNLSWDQLRINPFFKRVTGLRCGTASIFDEPLPTIGKSEAGLGLISGATSSLSGIDVTKFVQAFADFLKERIKGELTIAYIEKLKAILQNTVELRYLLPKTYHVFTTNDIYSIPSMGVIYKSAFAEDLDNLVRNFEGMVYSLPQYAGVRSSAGFTSFLLAYHYGDLSGKGYHPADIISTLDSRYGYKGDSASAISYHLSVINLLSANLRDTTAARGWISKGDLRLKNKDFLYLFLGLVYEKDRALFDRNIGGKSLTAILLEGSNAVDKVQELLVIANNIDDRIKTFKAMPAAEMKAQAVATFLNNADQVMQLLDFSFEVTIQKLSQNPDYIKWKRIMVSTLEVVKGSKENNTGKVSINSLELISLLLPESERSLRLLNQLTDFAKFISDMVEAKDAKDIKLVLDRYAAPISSYRAARSSRFSASIASYPGLYLGVERNNTAGRTDKTFGITAPLGFAFNWGNRDSSSLGLYLNFIDIGAALSFRWNNDSADLPKKITLGQIFSPGAFVIYGLKHSPLAFKAGLQYAPQLRSIRDGQNVTEEVAVVRYTVGISVDIPVSILSRKARR